MKRVILAALLIFIIAVPVFAADGVINIPSDFSVKRTADRMVKVLKKKGMTVFKRVKHSSAAGKVGITLRPTELIIFGNPKVGSPLMRCQQSVAIDLPQKVLIWKDENGKVWLTYNDPDYLKQRHSIEGCDGVLGKIKKALAGLTKAAAKK